MKTLPEQYFFRYAFPCTEVILQKKKITQQRFDDLKFAAENNIVPSRKILEDTYKTALENLKDIAAKEGRDCWDISVIKKYFGQGEHNNFIDSGRGEYGHAPESLKDMCRIKEGIVDDIKGDIIRVKYDSKERMCRNIYGIGLKKGSKVVIHYGYIVRKI